MATRRYKVVTNSGTLCHDSVPGTKTQTNKQGDPLSKEAAETLRDKANHSAEEMGIKTRYQLA